MLEQFLDAIDGIACAADARARIVAVGRRRWERFAAENGAPELQADRIIGRSLDDLVGGIGLATSYARRFEAILASGEPSTVALRCDGPGVYRELQMSAGPLRFPEGPPALLFQAQIVYASAPWSFQVSDIRALLVALADAADESLAARCAFCQRPLRAASLPDKDRVDSQGYRRPYRSSRICIGLGVCADCEAARFPQRPARTRAGTDRD